MQLSIVRFKAVIARGTKEVRVKKQMAIILFQVLLFTLKIKRKCSNKYSYM